MFELFTGKNPIIYLLFSNLLSYSLFSKPIFLHFCALLFSSSFCQTLEYSLVLHGSQNGL